MISMSNPECESRIRIPIHITECCSSDSVSRMSEARAEDPECETRETDHQVRVGNGTGKVVAQAARAKPNVLRVYF